MTFTKRVPRGFWVGGKNMTYDLLLYESGQYANFGRDRSNGADLYKEQRMTLPLIGIEGKNANYWSLNS